MAKRNSFAKRFSAAVTLFYAFCALVAFRRDFRTTAADAKVPGVFTISDNVNLVLLDVSVKDKKGGYVSGLQKENFKVSEDGQHRDITQFGTLDAPVSIGLVVDNSGSMRNKKAEVIMAGLAFARQSNLKDEFFVVNFNNSVVRGLPPKLMFTDQLDQIRAALFYGEPAGQTALYDAIAYSLKHLEYAHREKRTLIVVSDGGDNASDTSLADLMRMIEASRATIYTIGLYDAEDRDANPAVLRKTATVSGGEFFQPEKLEQVRLIFDRIANDIRNTYTIGYVPDAADHRTVHSVRVLAENHNRRLSVHTRTTYVTTPLSTQLAQGVQNQAVTQVRH